MANRFVLFELGFRPFYLLAAALAALSVPVWIAGWYGLLPQVSMMGAAWHAHEMVFGFAAAVIVGFLFTAARNWSGLPTPAGRRLAALAALWVTGRVLMTTGPGMWTAIVECAFLPLAALGLWFPLRRSRNRNLFFVGLLVLFGFANVMFHLAWSGVAGWSDLVPARGGLYLVVLIVSIMSGRVTPAFTRNAIHTARTRNLPAKFDMAAIVLLAATLALQLTGTGGWVLAIPALATMVLHGWRLWWWDPLATVHRPILWILHLSYAWIPLGLLLLALSAVSDQIPVALSLHALGAGAVGGTIIGMITRTARGHSGRPLNTGSAEMFAYVLVHAGALLRVVGPLAIPAWYGFWIASGAVAWSSAFVIYLIVYWPILSRPGFEPKRA